MSDRAVVHRIYVARGARAFADGFVSVLLPAYLLALGFGPMQVGILATATLVGSGLLTLAVGLHAHRWPDRTLLLAASALMAATGLAFALASDFWPLLAIAVVGTLNPSSGDVSVFLPLEHAALSRSLSGKQRTGGFARYSLVGAVGAGVGALAAALPEALARASGLSTRASLQAMFVLYALLGVIVAVAYWRLPRDAGSPNPAPGRGALTRSRRRVFLLAGLFSVDAFGGGFIVQSMLALWLYQRFGMRPETAGVLFFGTGMLAAVSYLVAARLAARFGLVNTMVFTHLPSSLCLVAIPFLDELGWVVALLLVRSALSQMDVPTRSSYVMAIVPPAERPAAASVTSVPRSLAAAASPFLAGVLLSASTFGWPLLAAGGLKIVYDLLLLGCFGNVRPPEEQPPS